MRHLQFRPIVNPSQHLQFEATGGWLGMFQSLEYLPGQGDEDPCYRTAYTRQMWNLDAEGVPHWEHLQPWASDELFETWFDSLDE